MGDITNGERNMIVEESSDETLLDAWRAGDRAAGDELLRRAAPVLVAFFRRRTSQNVDELVQRTLVACIQAATQFAGRSSFKGFLLGIARNQFLMGLRARRPSELQSTLSTFPEDGPSQLVASKEELKILVAALDATQSPFREALKMFYWDDLSVEQIARILGVPSGTVKSRLGRGRSMIRERLLDAAGPGSVVIKKW